MSDTLRLALVQTDLLVGDVDGNATQIIEAARRAWTLSAADLVVFPELALSGYPPEDLLFHRGFRAQIQAGLARLCRELPPECTVVVGFPEYVPDGIAAAATGRSLETPDAPAAVIHNAAAVIAGGGLIACHRKALLPNYKVFDEKRYFLPGPRATVVEVRGFKVGVLVCEDLWEPAPAAKAASAGAELLVSLNASPYELHKQRQREAVIAQRACENGLPIAYVNLVGGQDELVFDGNSFVTDACGQVVQRAPAFTTGTHLVLLDRPAALAPSQPAVVPRAGPMEPELSDEASIYAALVLGVRDYVGKHGFPGVVMGLSGGVDSALTLAIAVDALGPERVHAVLMPSRYTAQMSLDDAQAQALQLAVRSSVLPIEGIFEATLATLAPELAGRPPDATEENIQSRCRMLLLMGISNKTGRMLLTTGNKSEMAVGYATLYGDMAGGFAPIKDLCKLQVYRLAAYRNAISPVIPQRVLTRPPSAELRADQKDSDSLPPYEILDPILEAFIEEDLSVEEIVGRGYERATVCQILDLVKRNEYKRRQAPPGVRVSRRAFGRDWRYPITSGYRR